MEAKDLRRENDLTEERKRTGEAERRWRAEVDLQVWRRPYAHHTHNAHTTHTTHTRWMHAASTRQSRPVEPELQLI